MQISISQLSFIVFSDHVIQRPKRIKLAIYQQLFNSKIIIVSLKQLQCMQLGLLTDALTASNLCPINFNLEWNCLMF
jgi:hypothetical protein